MFSRRTRSPGYNAGCTSFLALFHVVQGREVELKLAIRQRYDAFIMEDLKLRPEKVDELWLVGKGGKSVVINATYASAMLNTVAGAGKGHYQPSNFISIPDAPIDVLRTFCVLLYNGRFISF